MGVKDREKTVIGGIGVSHLLRNVAQKCKKNPNRAALKIFRA